MRKLTLRRIVALLCLYVGLLLLLACKKKYFIDGGLANSNVGMSSFAFLAQHPDLDSIALLIEKAGLKDTVENLNITLFTPTNRGLLKYLRSKSDSNPDSVFTTLTQQEARNMIAPYIVFGSFNRDQMNFEGTLVKCLADTGTVLHTGALLVPLRGLLPPITSIPAHVYFSKTKGSGIDPYPLPTGFSKGERDLLFLCQTSGIITTNGVIHALRNGETINPELH